MIQYILECIAFQLVFLIIYDFFLKRETFFQWNRAYLIGTYILSLVLPWVKIESLKTTVPEGYYVYPEFLWNTNHAATTVAVTESAMFNISWEEGILYGGMLFAALYFGFKLYQIQKLRKNGSIQYFPNFTQIVVKNSELAFSFFKSIFLGDKVIAREHEGIIKHELVHIEQRHSWDLLFFELMRIMGWFNPLVYVYQSRISELHEFIADAKVAKTHKKEQYEFLLSQVFQTENISFVNQFFKSSLIKKRIVMLQKTKSKKVWQLKYLLLLPLVLGMLFYTSSEAQEEKGEVIQKQTTEDAQLIEKVKARIEKEVDELGSLQKVFRAHPNRSHSADSDGPIISKEAYFEDAVLFKISMRERLKNMSTKMAKKVGPKYKDYLEKIPLPSTERYESYVSRKKAFQVLDKNLKFSIISNAAEVGYDIELIDNNGYSNSSYELEVKDVRDLTGNEISLFNSKMDEIFKEENSLYSNLILRDSRYRFRVFATKPMIAINTFPGVSSTNESAAGSSQNEKVKIDVPFATVDEVPVFPGCEGDDDKRGCFYEKMREHIRKNFNYPKEAQEKGLQGRVAIMFTMTTEGGLANIKVRGPHKLLEEEAVRIISKLPKTKPGVHEGEEVNVIFSIPISFSLSGKKNGTAEKDLMSKYQELAMERQRLIKSANETNPVIVNLDQQMEELKRQILENHDGTVAFAWVDEVPLFPGCEDSENPRECFQKSMQKHISKNFRYPQEAQEKGIQGRVNIMFTISDNGAIQNVRMRGPDQLLEKEAARIIGLLPKMTPGKQKGKNVNVPFSIPITFRLQGPDLNPNAIKLKLDHGSDRAYIIDGVESTKVEYDALGEDRIESLYILNKDASIKKYGQEAKNGVIEVKTKKKD